MDKDEVARLITEGSDRAKAMDADGNVRKIPLATRFLLLVI